ncbi:TonB family protein [Anaeromyxobacter dehalogenans 2CP-1]|uniref:TonB family protein n=1 Tax=Anaeromyxobacter dehalogenans (strain ATCC BAA-258 / DSM 21875 / 2CP-1) TaxID=455488 RepID=B8JDZ2_ANAD2|nr:TonB family protein [Anaeromyxobacter dehalogenans]ACL66057.1 TonB family protein [Anaeromyxobacter dehalogenans 2CP-1]
MAFLGPSLRRRKVDERPGTRTTAAILLSLAFNALILLILGRVGAFQLGKPATVRPVALAPLTADQWAANRAIVGGQPPPAAAPRPSDLPKIPPPPPPPEERRAHGQIVDVAPSKDSRPPKDSRFLSDRDNTVEKESRSRFAGTQAFENTLPAPSDGLKRKAPPPPPEAGENGQAAKSTPGKEGPAAPHGTGGEKLVIPEQRAQERLAVAPRPDAPGAGDVPVAPRTDQQRLSGGGQALQVPGGAGAQGGGRKSGIDRRLLPDPQNLARIAGGPSPDRLDGVEEGDSTALNTRSFKYATFINRVGMAIYREWDPNRAYQARDPEGKVYPARDRTTSIELVLDGSGAIRFVKLLDSSGLDFLDQEVVRAARAAGPFPNPPAGLVDASGQIHLALAYTLEMRRASRVQVLMPSLPSQRPYPE